MLFLKQNMCFPHALITISRLHSSVQYKKYYATLSTTPMVLNEMQYDEIQSRLCVFCVLETRGRSVQYRQPAVHSQTRLYHRVGCYYKPG